MFIILNNKTLELQVEKDLTGVARKLNANIHTLRYWHKKMKMNAGFYENQEIKIWERELAKSRRGGYRKVKKNI